MCFERRECVRRVVMRVRSPMNEELQDNQTLKSLLTTKTPASTHRLSNIHIIRPRGTSELNQSCKQAISSSSLRTRHNGSLLRPVIS